MLVEGLLMYIPLGLRQSLPDTKRGSIVDELQKLVNEWPLEVIKHQKPEDRKVMLMSCTSGLSLARKFLPCM